MLKPRRSNLQFLYAAVRCAFRAFLNSMMSTSAPKTHVEQPGVGAAEPGAAALSTVADSVDLHELNAKSAGIGAWVLQVHKMQLIEYEYVWQSQPRKGQKLECRLVAPDGVYCQGVIRALPRSGLRGGGVDPAAELKTMQEKFKDGTVWRMTKVALSDEKSEYIGAPLKKCINLRKTKCASILQGSTKTVPAPAPEDELESIVALERQQRVDLTALIAHMSPPRRETTAYGQKDIVDITVVDGSKRAGQEDQVKAQVTLFFETSTSGAASLKSMRDVHASNTPVAFYGLTCVPRGEGRCEFKTGGSFFGEVASGEYAKLTRLQARASETVVAPASLITKEWQPTRSTRNFAAEEAVLSVCGWVAALLRPAPGGGASEPSADTLEGADDIFQINHCHIATPGPGDRVLTKAGDRIWLPNIRIMDATGSFMAGVREEAALALSGLASKDAFVEAHATDNISFPVLASVRVHLAKQKSTNDRTSQGSGAAEPALLNAVLVEGEDQNVDEMPTNALLQLRPILAKLALSTTELKIARLQEFDVVPHVGMAVDCVKCDLGLVLVGTRTKSEFQRFGEGYRLVTRNVHDVGFGASSLKPEDCPSGHDTGFDLVAICTEHNLTDYKLVPPRKAEMQYALVVVSDLRRAPAAAGAGEPGRKTFMVERVQPLQGADAVSACQRMLAKLKYTRSEFKFEGTKRDRSAWNDMPTTPTSTAKRVRRLSNCPTDASLPCDA